MNRAKIEDHPSLVRDLETGAVINRDTSAYETYLAKKRSKSALLDRIENLEKQSQVVSNTLSLILSKLEELTPNGESKQQRRA